MSQNHHWGTGHHETTSNATVRTLPFRVLALLLVAAVAATGCGDDTDDTSTGGTGSGSGTDDPSEAPDPGDVTPGGLPGDLLVSVESSGGFVPVGFEFRSVPQVVVYADGTVIVPGATIAIFPGAASVPLTTGTLDQSALDEVLAAAAEAGLLGEVPPDPGVDNSIADAPTTRITLVVDGRERIVEANALAESGADIASPGLTDEHRAVREALSEFVATVSDVASGAATDAYVPEGYRVMATGFDQEAASGEPAPNELAWPAGVPQPELGECLAITGDAVAPFEAVLAEATEITIWTVDAGEVTLAVRPLLPHEDGC